MVDKKDTEMPKYYYNKPYHTLINTLSNEFWYGQLILNFEGGKIVNGKKNESIKY